MRGDLLLHGWHCVLVSDVRCSSMGVAGGQSRPDSECRRPETMPALLA